MKKLLFIGVSGVMVSSSLQAVNNAIAHAINNSFFMMLFVMSEKN